MTVSKKSKKIRTKRNYSLETKLKQALEYHRRKHFNIPEGESIWNEFIEFASFLPTYSIFSTSTPLREEWRDQAKQFLISLKQADIKLKKYLRAGYKDKKDKEYEKTFHMFIQRTLWLREMAKFDIERLGIENDFSEDLEKEWGSIFKEAKKFRKIHSATAARNHSTRALAIFLVDRLREPKYTIISDVISIIHPGQSITRNSARELCANLSILNSI